MSFSVGIRTVGIDKAPGMLEAFRAGILARLSQMQDDIGNEVVGRSRENHLSGPRPEKLGTVSGDLRRSVGYRKEGDAVIIGTNLPYAPVHEFGATIRATKAKFLRFKTRDGDWFSKKSVTIPARPFLRPALEESKTSILDIVKAHAEAALREAVGG